MLNPIKAGIEWIASQIAESGATSKVLDGFKDFMGQIWAGMVWAISNAVPSAAANIMLLMGSMVKKMREDLVNLVLAYIQLTTTIPIDQIQLREYSAHDIANAYMKAFSQHPMQYILDLIKPDAPITPERGVEAAEKFMNVNMAFQIDAWILHFIADVLSWGQIKSLKDLPNAISWSFGIGWLSWLVMGTPFRIFIAEPQEWYWNYIYMPKRLNERQLAQALIQDMINGKEYEKQMRYLGWSQEKAWFLYDYNSDKPTFTQIKDLYQNTDIEEKDLDQLLKLQGWNWRFRKYAKILIKNDRLWDLQKDLEKEILRAYQDKRLTSDQASYLLRERGWTEAEVKTALTTQDMIRERRTFLPNSTLEKALALGVISKQEYRQRLMDKGYTPEDLDLLEAIKAAERERAEINRTYWARRQQLISALAKAGVENYWDIAKDATSDWMKIGSMTSSEWIKYMNSIISKYKP